MSKIESVPQGQVQIPDVYAYTCKPPFHQVFNARLYFNANLFSLFSQGHVYLGSEAKMPGTCPDSQDAHGS